MKIWKLKKFEREIIDVISSVPKKIETHSFFDELKKTVMFNKPLEEEEFATLYYAAVYLYNLSIHKGPDIVIAPFGAMKQLDKLNLDQLAVKSHIYKEIIQIMYITLALTKENGKEYCEGSLKYTEEQYRERRQLLENELVEMRMIAIKYIDGLEGKEIQIQPYSH